MSRKKKSGTWRLLTVLLVGGISALAWGAGPGGWFAEGESSVIAGAPARRGPLRISIVERGNLSAANSIDLASEVQGRTAVLYLIEEGAIVEPGELLVELDTSSLEEKRVSQKITVQNYEASHVAAKQKLAIQKSQNQSDMDAAQRKIDFARIDREKYVKGDWPQELRKSDDDILLAEATFAQAENTFNWSKQLEEQGFMTRTELDKDELEKKKSELAVALVKRQRELLIEYDNPKQLKTLEANVVEAQNEFERIELRAEARLVDYEADTRTTEARWKLEQERLQKILDQLGKARIVAPVAGMVVYYVEPGGRWGNREAMQEGREVRERQNIITMPQTEGMVAEVSLQEAVLEQVTEGQACVVKVDALPDRQFPGVVKFKAALPDQNSWFANPNQRLYRTEIELTASAPEMRPGMSCNVEILVEDLQDAVYVPLQSVFPDGLVSVVFVDGRGGLEKRTVELGPNNTNFVQIRAGLEEGEIVHLSRPPGFELAPSVEKEAEFEDTGPARRERAGEGRPGGDQAGGNRPGGNRAGGNRAGGDRAGDHGEGARGAPRGGGRPSAKADTGARSGRAGRDS